MSLPRCGLSHARSQLLMRISEVLSHFKRVFRDAQAGKVSKRPETGPMSEYMGVRDVSAHHSSH